MTHEPWQDLTVTHIRRMKPRALLAPFSNAQTALHGALGESPYYELLNGEWTFRMLESPRLIPGALDDELDVFLPIQVPGNWQMQGWGAPQYTNVHFPIPYDPPYVPEENDTGHYRRVFTPPDAFEGRRTILRFDGVDSAFFAYLNGELAGFSKCPHMPAEFDVTALIKRGRNQLDVFVLKWSDGTYLEDQDMWRVSGIFRDVTLISRALGGLSDARALATLRDDMTTGELTVRAEAGSPVTLTLYDKDQVLFTETKTPQNGACAFETSVPNARRWTAETPELYDLVLECAGDHTRVRVGFRRVEIRNAALYVNGMPVKLRGVNRHDTHCDLGHVTPLDSLLEDVLKMKALNVNCVRTSHYPNDPRFLDLCDEYGLYVIDEADLECHGVVYVGGYNLIAADPQWEKQFIDRGERMVARDFNHACVIFWSLGNESGYGCNHAAMAAAIRAMDLSRPIHYERDEQAQTADVVSTMYPTVEALRAQGEKEHDKPFFMCEYAHAMGQGPGNFKEYWELIYKYPRLIGGCVWEWVDHGMRAVDQNEREYFKYGGDFGDFPNDGNFCVDALLSPDREPHSAALSMKRAYQPASFELEGDTLIVHNRLSFTNLNIYTLQYSIKAGTRVIVSGEMPLHCPPLETRRLPFFIMGHPEGSVLTFSLHQKMETPFAKIGYEAAFEQFCLEGGYREAAEPRAVHPLMLTRGDDVTIEGRDFSLTFDTRRAMLLSAVYSGEDMLLRGVRPNLWRAPTDNDCGVLRAWREAGLDRLLCRVEESSSALLGGTHASVSFSAVYAPVYLRPILRVRQNWLISGNGALTLTVRYEPLKDDLPYLPRLGLRFQMPRAFDRVLWQGRGAGESYPDKKNHAKLGFYTARVRDTHEDYVRPQENGAHEDTSFFAVYRPTGPGLLITSDAPFSFTAHHYSIETLQKAEHQNELKEDPLTEVLVDGVMGGLGSNSCGPEPTEDMRIYLKEPREFTFTILPFDAQRDDPSRLAFSTKR